VQGKPWTRRKWRTGARRRSGRCRSTHSLPLSVAEPISSLCVLYNCCHSLFSKAEYLYLFSIMASRTAAVAAVVCRVQCPARDANSTPFFRLSGLCAHLLHARA
jgi:hypothetical protein